jgi:hypothetical protein
MQRSEFHDPTGRMRSPRIVQEHLDAFAAILIDNSLHSFPRIFVPPALNHSFGNGSDSFQAILHEYGVQYVITKFARARQYTPPLYEKMTWEEGVVLLERGDAPVGWAVSASSPPTTVTGPVVPLHWANLLHPDPERNSEIVESWAATLLAAANSMERFLATDAAACFFQAAACYLGELRLQADSVLVDLSKLPSLVFSTGSITVKILDERARQWGCRGGRILNRFCTVDGYLVLEILPDQTGKCLELYPLLAP